MDLFFGGIFSVWLLIAAVPVGLVVLGIVALTNRRDDDPEGRRATALYLGIVCFLTLFTVLLSGTAAVGKATSFIVPAGDRGGEPQGEWFNYSPGSGLMFDSDGTGCFRPRCGRAEALDEVDDATTRGLVWAGLVFLPAAAVLVFHLRRRRTMVDGDGFVGTAAWRTDRAYLHLVCVVSLVLAVVAASSALYDLVRLLFPDITTSDPLSRRSERERAVADGITMTVLLVGSSLIFGNTWSQASGEPNPLRRLRPFRRKHDAEVDAADG